VGKRREKRVEKSNALSKVLPESNERANRKKKGRERSNEDREADKGRHMNTRSRTVENPRRDRVVAVSWRSVVAAAVPDKRALYRR